MTTSGSFRIVALLGPNPVKITDGFGGWQVVDRPRRVGLTQYQGRTPFQMSVNLMFDGFKDNQSQERDIRVLTWMGLPPKDGTEPLPVKIVGKGLPFPNGGEWLINDIQWGDNIIWSTDSNGRVRQDVTIILMQKVVEDRVAFQLSGIGLSPPKPNPYIVKKGDSIRGLAQKYLGDVNLWRKIAELNALRDPANLKVGSQLRLP